MTPEQALVDTAPDGEVVGVPPSLVEHAQPHTAIPSEPDQVVGLLGGQGEGLVDDDVPAGLERGPGHVVVRGVGHRHDDQLDGRVVEQGRERRHHGTPGRSRTWSGSR